MIASGCSGFLAHIMDTKKEESQKMEETPVVYNYLDIFSDELSGLPPSREIEFEIELILGTDSISKSPYCMAPAKLKEFQE